METTTHGCDAAWSSMAYNCEANPADMHCVAFGAVQINRT
jgi:hypothetical protein